MAEAPIPGEIIDISPPRKIRVETAISRFPIHRLSKKTAKLISVHRLDTGEETDIKWEVSFNSKVGQPGPLAYKIDTLVINRRFDEIGRPLPELIRLGSYSEICKILGLIPTGPNFEEIRRALAQNASAFIDAKIHFKSRDGYESYLDVNYNRYTLLVKGSKLPNGAKADAVYILLNQLYRDLLNSVEVRPLDYNYLICLAPGPQRLYELLSFQIFGALASGRPRAKMLYSEYCAYAPQKRYPDFDHVKRQMYKLHLPHRKSGYIEKVEYQRTKDAQGNCDWEMFYTPGPKAKTEFEAFTNRQLRQEPEIVAPPALPPPAPRRAPASPQLSENDAFLLAEMTRRGIAEKTARKLIVARKPDQEILDQLEYVDFIVSKDRRGKFDNPPGMCVWYVQENITPPADFLSSRKLRLFEEAQQAKNAARARQAQIELDYEEYQREQIRRYVSEMPVEKYREMYARRHAVNQRQFKFMTASQLDEVTKSSISAEVREKGLVAMLPVEEFARQWTGESR